MVRRELTPVSYVVLGMLMEGPATSYDLKQHVAETIWHFWEFNHSQLYDEPARLVADGLLTEHREEHGRRRRIYTITDEGRRVFAAWLAESGPHKTEVRDLGLLKLFFADLGTPEDRIRLATEQARVHRERAAEHERRYAKLSAHEEFSRSWGLATLELGIRYEQMAARFWDDLLRRDAGAASADAASSGSAGHAPAESTEHAADSAGHAPATRRPADPRRGSRPRRPTSPGAVPSPPPTASGGDATTRCTS